MKLKMGSLCCKRNNIGVLYEKECIPCRFKGIHSKAVAYCYTCDGCLCENCLKKHRGGCCSGVNTTEHHIGDIPPTPVPTPVPLPPPPRPQTPPPPPPRIPTPPREPTPIPVAPKLVPAGELMFMAGGTECCVTGYDVLENGKIVIADGKNKHIYIFNPDNTLLCKLHVKWALDVAALSNSKLVFVYGEKCVVFVLIGVRYRHMEIEKEVVTEFRCLRVRHYREKIYVVCIDYVPYTSFVVILNMKGLKVKKILSPEFSMNFITINPSSNEIFVTGIAGGMKVFDQDGNTLASYRDVDIQWYYGIASDRYGNVFVCTQDEFGPEVYMLEQETYGTDIKTLSMQLTAKEGLKTPYRICYNPYNDTMLVGSNDINVVDETIRVNGFRPSITTDNQLPVPVENKDPDVAEQEVRVKHALMEGSWGSNSLNVYKIEYSYAVSSGW